MCPIERHGLGFGLEKYSGVLNAQIEQMDVLEPGHVFEHAEAVPVHGRIHDAGLAQVEAA